MMKRNLTLLIALISAIFLNAKTLIVYYSYTNNIHRVVAELQSQIGADAIRIEPAEKGLDYAANNYSIGSAQIAAIRSNPDDVDSYPEIDPVEVDLSEYSTIIIGAPLWWSNMAAPLQTFLFLHGAEMAGKNIGLIVSSASSGISGVESDAKRLIPDGKFLSPSLWIRSSQTSGAASMIENWLKDIDYSSLNTPDMTHNQITIKVGENTDLTATLADNSSASALLKLLETGPVTINMRDYANMEKVGELPESLPRNDSYITTQPGDLVLYLGNQFVIYYDNNSYDLTRLGRIDGNYTGSQLKSILGSGNVIVTLSAGNITEIMDVTAENHKKDGKVYDLKGNVILQSATDLASLTPGVYIVNGKKTLIEKRKRGL